MFFAKYDAMDIAEYIINYCDKELDNPITNLQLQKTLYYIQGVYLARYGEPLFDNDIEAWRYGPVVSDVYYSYNSFLSNKIKDITVRNEGLLEDNDVELVRDIVNKTIKENPWELVKKTHEEEPWEANYVPNGNAIIPYEDIENYFINNKNIENWLGVNLRRNLAEA